MIQRSRSPISEAETLDLRGESTQAAFPLWSWSRSHRLETVLRSCSAPSTFSAVRRGRYARYA